MELSRNKLKKIHGYEEGKSDSIDPESLDKALAYKKNFLKNFISINQTQIESRLSSGKFFVTRKYDGEYAIIFYDRGTTVTVNRSGRVREGIPCIEEAGKLISEAGIQQAIIPAEIYVHDTERKTRVNDLISALADKNKISSLKLAVFDILEVDHKNFNYTSYKDIHDRLLSIFGNGILCSVVDMEIVNSGEKVSFLFRKWVDEEGSEGLVVRTELPVTYKIKPRHNIDVVVVGFSEGTGIEAGQARSLLTAMIPENGKYQIIGRVGSGLYETLRKDMYKKFIKKR